MALAIEQVASNVVLVNQATITATFAAPIEAGESVGVIAVYVGALGPGTCADASARAFELAASVAGVGWTVSTFYFDDHPGGDTQITFTAPGAVTNKGIIAFRISADGEIQFADSAVSTQAAPGTDTDAISTGSMSIPDADAAMVAASLNINASGTLSAGTNQVSQGEIWNNFGHAESRLVTGPGDFASTWTTTGGGDSFVSGALAFIEVPPDPPYDSGFYIDGQTEQVLASPYGRTLLYNDGQGNFFKIEES